MLLPIKPAYSIALNGPSLVPGGTGTGSRLPYFAPVSGDAESERLRREEWTTDYIPNVSLVKQAAQSNRIPLSTVDTGITSEIFLIYHNDTI